MLPIISSITLFTPVIICFYYIYNYIKQPKKVDFFSYFLVLTIPMMYMNTSIPFYYTFVNLEIIVVIFKGLIDFFRGKTRIVISKSMKWFVLFFFTIVILGLISGIDAEFYSGIRNMICFSLCVVFAYQEISKSVDIIFKPMLINLILTSCLSILEVIIYYVNYRSFVLRPMGFAHNANYNSFFILYMLLFVQYTNKINNKRAFVVKTIALLSALATQSSAGLIGIIICLAGRRKLGKRVIRYIIYGALLVILALVIIRLENYDLYLKLFPSQGDRMVLWSVWIKAFKEHPLIGFGYNKFAIRYGEYIAGEVAVTEKAVKALQIYTGFDVNYTIPERLASHNDLIKLLTETGIVGISFFSVFIIKLMKEASRINVIILKMIAMTFVFFITNNPLNSVLFYIGCFFIVLLEKQEIKKGIRIAWRNQTTALSGPN